jgi:hypothetical protein
VAARALLYAYKRRLRGIVKLAPTWVSEGILSTAEHMGDRRAAALFEDN